MRITVKRISLVSLVLIFISAIAFGENATVDNKSNRDASASAFVGMSSVGVSSTFNLGFASDDYAWVVIPSGSPTVVNVRLECTQDGANWFKMDNYSTASPENEYRSVNNKTCQMLRWNLLGLDAGAVTVRLKAK